LIDSEYIRLALVNLNGQKEQKLVHVLVATVFIPNPDNKPTVNHKDHNRSNNHVENLEWATFSEQNNHKTKSLRSGKTCLSN